MSIEQVVPPWGDPTSKIMIVGEAPGREEAIQGIPFVGKSGKLLWRILGDLGVKREDCYVTNVLDKKPVDNNFNSVGKYELNYGLVRLGKEICQSKANIIVLLGEKPLKYTTLKEGITNWRGSILPHANGKKFLPTLHPASVLRNWVPGRQCLEYDLKRAVEQSSTPDWKAPMRDTVRITSLKAAQTMKRMLLLNPEWPIAVDIESDKKTKKIISVGFSDDPAIGYCVYQIAQPYDDPKILNEIKQITYEILESPNPKVTHMGTNFDIQMLYFNGYNVVNHKFDTFCAHHMLYVELPRTLQFLTSIYTEEPYYKWLSDVAMKGMPDWDMYAKYNCLDAMVTLEIARKLQNLMTPEQKEFYNTYYNKLLVPLLEAEYEGVRIDVPRRTEVAEELQEELGGIIEELQSQVPEDWQSKGDVKILATLRDRYTKTIADNKQFKKDGTITKRFIVLQDKIEKLEGVSSKFNPASPTQVAEVLYRTLKARPRKNKGNITTDDEALTKTIKTQAATKKVRQFCQDILRYRGTSKLLSTYLLPPIDSDGRVRCTYNIGVTKTGRLSSEANVLDSGFNLQNIPKNKGRDGLIRGLFLPDIRDVFVSADLSQAEARVVAYLAKEQGLINKFESGEDVFKYVASLVFNIKAEDISYDQRFTAKTLVHATNYGMGLEAFTFKAELSQKDARPIWNRYRSNFPMLLIWRERIKEQVDKSRVLTTPMGRHRMFFNRVKEVTINLDKTYFVKYIESYLRDAYSYIPQSTVGDLLNLGLIRSYEAVCSTEWIDRRPRFRLQVHDQVVYSCLPDNVEQLSRILKESLEIPIMVNGKELIIPCEVEVGKDWSEI